MNHAMARRRTTSAAVSALTVGTPLDVRTEVQYASVTDILLEQFPYLAAVLGKLLKKVSVVGGPEGSPQVDILGLS